MVWGKTENNYLCLYRILKMEERQKKTKQKMRPTRYEVAALVGEEMTQQLTGKQAGSLANIAVFENYGDRQQGWNKREGV